jgi:hypothetical protein
MQRGVYGVTFECYPAPQSSGSPSDVNFTWTPWPIYGYPTANSSALISTNYAQTWPNTSQVGFGFQATAQGGGTYTGLFTAATLGQFASPAENYMGLLICPGPAGYGSYFGQVNAFQHNMAVQQAANAYGYVGNGTQSGFGASLNVLAPFSQNSAGYVCADLSFSPTSAQQVAEAESSWVSVVAVTASVFTDATASGGKSVRDLQTIDTNWTIDASGMPASYGASLLAGGKYRMFARVKTDTGLTGNLGFGIYTAASGGHDSGFTAVASASAGAWNSWIWIDCGEVVAPNYSGCYWYLRSWSNGNGTSTGIYIDRVELFLIEDKTRSSAIFSGARDLGQSVLFDARQTGALVGR